ncbi:cupin domain-containing protein [Streptomyces sp. NPDC098789]|uniref:cupin domain-containing protein n=1 Tax=Streptomyces sp. NPDC098789 TaxID=3366098 RepID=UPI0038131A30
MTGADRPGRGPVRAPVYLPRPARRDPRGSEPHGDPVVTETLVRGEAAEPFELSVSGGPCRTVIQRTVVPPGAETGWHYHPGDVVVVVARGVLTHYDAIGRVEVHPAGTSFQEPAGMIHAHLGRNEGEEPVVLYATHLVPLGRALALPVPVVPRQEPGRPAAAL